ncbi:MAG: hypothetical protein RLZZ350_1287 [Verrucomicrobiota bacterium]|jgi:type IV pilus biogenesis protein CpaD/CtpE
MKTISLLLLALATLLLPGCGSLNPSVTDNLPRFRDSKSADLVVIYYAEKSIFITKPDTRENGFLPLLSRENVSEYLVRPEIGRGLGVIIIGQMTTDAEQTALMDDWQTQLSQRGFRRIVCLRAGASDERIDGLPILRDSAIASRADEAAPAQTVAAITSAP